MVFLADVGNVRVRRLHGRIKNRFRTDSVFRDVRLGVADEREPGPYRVVAETNPRTFLDDGAYPATEARLAVGFQRTDRDVRFHYWFNWIEPDRRLLIGWHRDEDHPELGPVHVQVTRAGRTVDRAAAQVLDDHPMAIVEARLDAIVDLLDAVRWDGDDAVGVEW